jgi:hypothetical protein
LLIANEFRKWIKGVGRANPTCPLFIGRNRSGIVQVEEPNFWLVYLSEPRHC